MVDNAVDTGSFDLRRHQFKMGLWADRLGDVGLDPQVTTGRTRRDTGRPSGTVDGEVRFKMIPKFSKKFQFIFQLRRQRWMWFDWRANGGGAAKRRQGQGSARRPRLGVADGFEWFEGLVK